MYDQIFDIFEPCLYLIRGSKNEEKMCTSEISNNKKKENDWIAELLNIWQSRMCRY